MKHLINKLKRKKRTILSAAVAFVLSGVFLTHAVDAQAASQTYDLTGGQYNLHVGDLIQPGDSISYDDDNGGTIIEYRDHADENDGSIEIGIWNNLNFARKLH